VSLRPPREMFKDLVDFARWCKAQTILVEDEISITESQVSDLGDYVTTTQIKTGQGTPEGAVKGSVSNLYLRTDGGTNTTLYVKESGNETLTGWVAM